jgi:hypothetical protein
MAIIEEYHHLIELDPRTSITQFQDGEAMNDRIKEWFETPEGTVADLPAWGHNLLQFKHEPLSPSLSVMVKTAILRKMPVDIRNLFIIKIAVEFKEIDLCYTNIVHRMGTYVDGVLI